MNDNSDDGVDIKIVCEDEDLVVREPEDNNNEWVRVKDNDGMYVFGKKVFRDIDHDFSSNGYQKLGGSGLIIQWGHNYVSGDGGTKTVSYPVTFPNNVLSVVTVPNEKSSGGGQSDYWGIYDVDSDSFTQKNDYDGGQHFYWFAIGY